MILGMAMSLALAAQTGCVELPAGVDAKTAGAQAAPWYINNDTIAVKGKKYTKYGLPRQLAPFEIALDDAYKGALVYIEAGSDTREVVYVLVNHAECAFQPYQVES